MKIKECMNNNVTYALTTNTVEDCAKLMNEKHIGCIPVCNESEQIVGLITDRDIVLRCVACSKEPNTTPVSEIMTCNPCWCTPEANISEVQNLMSENQVKRIPVVQNKKVVGIVTVRDLALNSKVDDNSVTDTIENICGSNEKNAE